MHALLQSCTRLHEVCAGRRCRTESVLSILQSARSGLNACRSPPQANPLQDDNFQRLLLKKLANGIAMPLPVLTRRDAWIPRVTSKVLAVIGMRRSGTTSLATSGLPRISLEVERIIGAGPELLDGLLETWYTLHSQWRQPQPKGRRPCLLIDEVQVIPGWEGLCVG